MTSLSNIHYTTNCVLCSAIVYRDLLGEDSKAGVLCGNSECGVSLCAECYLLFIVDKEEPSVHKYKCPVCKTRNLWPYKYAIVNVWRMREFVLRHIVSKWDPVS